MYVSFSELLLITFFIKELLFNIFSTFNILFMTKNIIYRNHNKFYLSKKCNDLFKY